MVEGYQILKTLVTGKGWIHHPAVLQWTNHELALYEYIGTIWEECKRRNIAPESQLYFKSTKLTIKLSPSTKENPKWWGREDIISSHRGRLICKGEIDVICAGIKKSKKIRSINDWLKINFKKDKNQMRYEDIPALKSYLTNKEIQSLSPNHYLQFNWKEIGNEQYVWPV